MKKHKICLLTTLLLFLLQLSAQKQLNQSSREHLMQEWRNDLKPNINYFSIYSGYASFSMHNLRDYFSEMNAGGVLPYTVINNFSPYFVYGLSYAKQYDKLKFGYNLQWLSAGARAGISDYSGQVRNDIECSGWRVGVTLEKQFAKQWFEKQHIKFGYGVEIGGVGSEVKITNYQLLYDYSDMNSQTVKHVLLGTFFIEPSLLTKWSFSKSYSLDFKMAYMMHAHGSVFTANADRNDATDPDNYAPSWTGLRLNIGLTREF